MKICAQVVLLLSLGTSVALACLELPKKIKQTSVSFNEEVFEVVNGEYGPQFKNGDSQFFFNYKKIAGALLEKLPLRRRHVLNQGQSLL